MKGSATADLTFDCLVHDLNNVFQTIIDAAELVGCDPDLAGVAGILMRSVEQGRRIVASIAEQDHGSVALELIADSAIQFASDVVVAMKGPNVEFVREVSAGIHVRLKPASLERVLVNLLINAAQAAKAGGRERCSVRISAHEGQGMVRIEVTDDGPGIPEHFLDRIFTPRFSTDGGRTGLGLHIVQTLVSDAGGRVDATNGRTGGAIFTIELPGLPMHAEARRVS